MQLHSGSRLPYPHLLSPSLLQNKGSQQQLAGELVLVAASSALDRQRVVSLYCGEDATGAQAVPAELQPLQSEAELGAALDAAQADAAQNAGPNMQRALAVVRWNAWGSSGAAAGLGRLHRSMAGMQAHICQAQIWVNACQPASHVVLPIISALCHLLNGNRAFCPPCVPAGGEQDPALSRHGERGGEDSTVWALACAANHSCSPNAHIVFVAGAVFLRASRAIPAGGATWQPCGARCLCTSACMHGHAGCSGIHNVACQSPACHPCTLPRRLPRRGRGVCDV